MNCIDQGKLLTFIDGELSPEAAQAVADHLELCPNCNQKHLHLLEANRITQAAVGTYAGILNTIHLDAEKSWENFKMALTREKVGPQERKVGMGLYSQKRYLAAGIAAAVLIVALSLVPGTRTLAAEFLSIFRVEQVQVVDLDRGSLEEFHNRLQKQLPVNFEKFIAVKQKPTFAPENIAPQQAASQAGFNVLLPDTLAEAVLGEVIFQPGSSAVVTPRVQEINEYLQSSGSQKLLPAELDGAEITVTLPNRVTATYGNLQLVQTAAPEIAVPEGINLEEIRSILLLSPLLPDDIRLALASVKDWQRTMVIPNFEGTSKEVQVNGAQGVFISPPHHPEQNYNHPSAVLVWPRGEVWMTISGNLTLGEALELAKVLR